MKEVSLAITIQEDQQYEVLPVEVTDSMYPAGIVRVYEIHPSGTSNTDCAKALEAWVVNNMINKESVVGQLKYELVKKESWIEFGYLEFKIANPGYWMHTSQFLPLGEFLSIIRNPIVSRYSADYQ